MWSSKDIKKPLRLAKRKAIRAKNKLTNLVDAPIVVLIYHRVTSLPKDPQMLTVSPSNFYNQLKFLKDNYPIVRFDDDWSNNKKPSICITFDDGYADNYLEALPIIEELEVPVTFFISTGTLDTLCEFWWDELERLILLEDIPASSCKIHNKNKLLEWNIKTPRELDIFYKEIHSMILNSDYNTRENLMIQLRQWAGKDECGRSTHRALSFAELKHFSGSKNVTIGAHTVTHSSLSKQSVTEQQFEITSSKKTLEQLIGSEVNIFSYPFGTIDDYTIDTIKLLKESGFKKAASNFPGQFHKWSDQYQIPRNLVRNWDVDTFAKYLKGYFIV